MVAIFSVCAFTAVTFAAIGDSTVAAALSGVFTLVNTLLLLWAKRELGHVKSTLTAPRRLIYDQDGNPIGTVLDLKRGNNWDSWVVAQNRRVSDPPGPSTDPEVP